MNEPNELPTLVVASRNRKKSAEIAALLEPHGISVASVAEFPDVAEVVEDGDSFAANAAKKASQTACAVGRWTLGEDSGLMVDALGGKPGIHSARYSGANATDESNNAKLMAELADVSDDRRGARYVCHVSIADPAGTVRLDEEATCRGRITREPRGTNGVGYDPYFLIPENGKTFGESSATVKQRLSHRARAFERIIPRLVRLLRSAD